MKRRKFLISGILFGLGVLTSPSEASAKEDIVTPLPGVEAPIRLDDFNLDKINGIQFPNGISNVRFQRFYKNGFIEGPDDLCIVTFEFQSEIHVVQFKFYELCDAGFIDCGRNKSNKKVFRLI